MPSMWVKSIHIPKQTSDTLIVTLMICIKVIQVSSNVYWKEFHDCEVGPLEC
jgi:hypothetical protein